MMATTKAVGRKARPYAVGRRELVALLFTDIQILNGRVEGYWPRPDRAPDLVPTIDSIVTKLSVSVGGDGSQTPLTDSLRLIV